MDDSWQSIEQFAHCNPETCNDILPFPSHERMPRDDPAEQRFGLGGFR